MASFCVYLFSLILAFAGIPALASCEKSDGILRGFNVNGSLKEEDFKVLSSLNVNAVRLSLADLSAFEHSGAVSKTALDVVDKYIAWGEAYGIGVVLDIHNFPKARKKYSGTPNDGIWSDPSVREGVLRGLQEIANRYKNKKYLVALDVMNEPSPPPGKADDYKNFLREIVSAVRGAGFNKTIYIQPPISIDKNGVPTAQSRSYGVIAGDFGQEVRKSVHYYDPGDFTHQGIHRFKRDVALPYPLKTDLGLQAYFDIGLRDVGRQELYPVLIGEFGVSNFADPHDSLRYLRVLISTFETRGWSWFFHAFREAGVWNPELEIDSEGSFIKPARTERLSLLQKYFLKNSSITCVLLKDQG